MLTINLQTGTLIIILIIMGIIALFSLLITSNNKQYTCPKCKKESMTHSIVKHKLTCTCGYEIDTKEPLT